MTMGMRIGLWEANIFANLCPSHCRRRCVASSGMSPLPTQRRETPIDIAVAAMGFPTLLMDVGDGFHYLDTSRYMARPQKWRDYLLEKMNTRPDVQG